MAKSEYANQFKLALNFHSGEIVLSLRCSSIQFNNDPNNADVEEHSEELGNFIISLKTARELNRQINNLLADYEKQLKNAGN